MKSKQEEKGEDGGGAEPRTKIVAHVKDPTSTFLKEEA